MACCYAYKLRTQMNTPFKFPFYIKTSLLFIGFYVLVSMLSIGQTIILPLIFAIIIAILISPMVNFFVRKKINRAVAITGVLLITLLIVAGLIALLSSQASRFREALPQLTDKFQELIESAVAWASGYFNISAQKINAWIIHEKDELLKNSSAAIGSTLTSMGGMLTATFLTPVYVFMILFYQPHLLEFIHQLFGVGNDKRVREILTETKGIIQNYLVGLFAEFVILAVLNSAGLLILGIEYAILLGIAGAFLNLIPYLGGLIGVLIFMIIALVTKAPIYILYVFLLYGFIQFLDNYFLVPKIVGSKVKLNALVCILAVIAGAALWGIPGMFLAIPLTALIKLIFDRIESLKPWGFLLGDTIPPLVKLDFNFKDTSKKLPGFFSRFRKKKEIKEDILK
ncbi:MAG: AI-2E family transporter [Chitinophagales bacterium]|nr:AI-2E family transporter [Chitinophagales bacterium]